MAAPTPVDVDLDVLPKQLQFLKAQEREVMYSGAFGAGKSRAICFKTAMHGAIPGNFVGLCRKTLVDLKKTTLRTLLKVDANLPPVLPDGCYDYNKSDQIISIRGGGEILCFGFDDPPRLGSLNFGFVGIDEGIELAADEYTMLLGRLRNLADPCRQIAIATNPGPPAHFLHERFFDEREPSRRLIQTTSLENYYLPADYIASLLRFKGTDRQRYVEGLWVAFEGLIYELRRETHVIHRDGPWRQVIAGVDEGFTAPGVIFPIGIDGDGRAHVIEEFYETQVAPQAFVAAVVRCARKHHIREVRVDPAAAGLIADLQNAGVPAQGADNAVLAGIRTVQDALVVAGDGRPRLTIEPSCTNLIRGLESYVWKPGRDEPVLVNDHGPDALRYALHGFAPTMQGPVYRTVIKRRDLTDL